VTMRAPSTVRDLWKVLIAWGAVTLVLGILMLARPETSIVVAAALLGTYLVMSGIVEMVLAFVLDVSASSRIPLVITGGLSLALGVLAFRYLGYADAVLLLAIWIGVAFIFQGVSEIALAVEYPSLPDRGWYIFLGVTSVIAGIVMLAWPFTSLGVATIVAGGWLVVIGMGEIFWALRARRALGDVQRRAGRLTGSSAGPATES
jgi:uncharacterized membrane protein HdeD (DUF308 family)